MIERDKKYLMDYEDSGFSDTGSFDRPPTLLEQRTAASQTPEGIAKLEADNKQKAVMMSLTQQIMGQNLTDKWSGQGWGSAEANARDMAKILAGIGITDISQFGKISVPVEEYVGTEYEGGPPVYETRMQETFGNKLTGQAVPNTYSERQRGDFFGGTFEGKGNTGYGVKFDDQGNPLFYTQGASSNDLANLMADLGPIAQIGLAIATGGLSIPQQIAAQMAVGVLSGQNAGDAIKNAAISFAMANIPGSDLMKEGSSFIKDLGLPADITKTLNSSFQNAAMSGARALLTGTDISDAVMRGASTGGMNGAINAITGNIDGFKDLTPAQKNLVVNTVTGVMSGKPLDQIVINSAIAAANAEIYGSKNAGTTSSSGAQKDFYDTEKARLTAAGYSKDQIKQYFGNLENLTEDLDFEPEVPPVDKTPPSPTRSLGGDPVKTLEDAGLNYLPTDDDFVPTIRDPNEVVITTDRDKTPSYSPIDDYFKPTFKYPVTDAGELRIVDGRPLKYLPTDDDFMPTPIRNEGELTIVGERPVKEPPAETPGTPKTPTVKPPSVKPTAPTQTKTPFNLSSLGGFPVSEAPATKLVTPDLANVYYYGKDFGSQKQKINEEGELEQSPYKPVLAAAGGLVDEQKNRENNVIDALDLIMGESSNSMSVDDLLNIVKGS
jgi:hypothetical protein